MRIAWRDRMYVVYAIFHFIRTSMNNSIELVGLRVQECAIVMAIVMVRVFKKWSWIYRHLCRLYNSESIQIIVVNILTLEHPHPPNSTPFPPAYSPPHGFTLTLFVDQMGWCHCSEFFGRHPRGEKTRSSGLIGCCRIPDHPGYRGGRTASTLFSCPRQYLSCTHRRLCDHTQTHR